MLLAEHGRDVRHHHPQAIRRGTFTSVKDLTTAVDAYNDRCQPFTWTMTPTNCSPKSNRQRINAMRH